MANGVLNWRAFLAVWAQARRRERTAGETPLTPPAAPSGLDVYQSDVDVLTLAWEDNADNETGFEIERAVDGSEFGAWAEVPAESTGIEDTGLPPGAYAYRVRAFNAAGYSAWSNEANGEIPVV